MQIAYLKCMLKLKKIMAISVQIFILSTTQITLSTLDIDFPCRSARDLSLTIHHYASSLFSSHKSLTGSRTHDKRIAFACQWSMTIRGSDWL